MGLDLSQPPVKLAGFLLEPMKNLVVSGCHKIYEIPPCRHIVSPEPFKRIAPSVGGSRIAVSSSVGGQQNRGIFALFGHKKSAQRRNR